MSLILFDQNVPRALIRLLAGRDIRTAADRGWSERLNGDLLTVAEAAGFAIMVTCDQHIRHQQNSAGRRISLVVLSTNHWPTLRGSAERIATALDTVPPAGIVLVDCGLPPRRRRPPPPSAA